MSLPGPEPRNPALPGYEYCIVDIDLHSTREDATALLNNQGIDGWELIFVTNVITDDTVVRAWFIRPLQ